MPWARSRSSCDRRPGGRAAISSSISFASPRGRSSTSWRASRELHRERHEVLLRAVVEVALDPAALGVAAPRRCGPGTRAARRPGLRTSSRDSCSAESSCTLCSARPTWRASSVSAWSSSSSNGSPSSARRTTMRPSSSTGVRDRRDAHHRLRAGPTSGGIHTRARCRRTPARATTGSPPVRSSREPGGPGRPPPLERRRPGPHLGRRRAHVFLQRLGELEQQLVERERG